MISRLRTNNRIRKAHRRYIAKMCRYKTWLKYSRKYEAPLLPLKTISVSPADITDVQRERELLPSDTTIPHVFSGNWDTNTVKLKERGYYQSLYDHFEEDVAWEDTNLYTRYIDHFSEDNPDPRHGCRNMEEYKQRLSMLDNIYTSIKKGGYKSQSEVNDKYIPSIHNKGNKKLARAYPPIYNEVTINIGREGELILWEGRHRATIANLLSLDSIPVRVFIRHRRWQETRDKYYKKGISYRKYNHVDSHPDLAAIERMTDKT